MLLLECDLQARAFESAPCVFSILIENGLAPPFIGRVEHATKRRHRERRHHFLLELSLNRARSQRNFAQVIFSIQKCVQGSVQRWTEKHLNLVFVAEQLNGIFAMLRHNHFLEA